MATSSESYSLDSAPLPREQGSRPSPFFYTSPITEADTLAMLHLKRDNLLPITLRSTADDGYAEGAVTNTRFGSFPHSTLIGLEWGSQVRASKVDTGTRGRKGKFAKHQPKDNAAVVEDGAGRQKRKSNEMQLPDPGVPAKKLKQLPPEPTDDDQKSSPKLPIEAGSGFVHVLPPTPEAWTSSLDHRTQLVYTPDYSYILQRLRVRPGSTIIEAGAGSGSFTHAAARAVFNGYADASQSSSRKRKLGQVYSYEYHERRVQTLRSELQEHGLDSIITLTHRDVCNDGFALPEDSTQPEADAIFLDLPAPWLALKHLSRATPNSPMNSRSAVHLCSFSPCIEQVMSTVSFLRKNNWTEISMVEVANKRIDVRRERIGLKEEGLRGVNASAATVDEAIGRLREVEGKIIDFHANKDAKGGKKIESKAERLRKIKAEAESRKLYREGDLVHRTEPEVKTHTSYLVFAVLPNDWSEENERTCEERWGVEEVMRGGGAKEEDVEGGKV